ncbi:hypothetical protein KGF56_001978 [Candida oxycetoniae]|uniref:DUF2470 domain-containing protein n=1 Tax=Candida oxycetoniae TaxID=497107 RepID=A0AAI9SYY2_9ASCO|nr:uncharacterized protein KGF56_001978 [Candida oxycetoniae]KAI3405233.1 hypothetical protein KGF56_001978 [Candida oxycetoniae]
MSDPSTRIKSHMNKDHQLSLNDYVIVYDSVDPKYLVEDSVHITDVDTNHLVIEYDLIKPNSATSITKTLALYWTDAEEAENIQVKSLSDIKGKLIAMAKYCAEKQGYAMTKITKIVGPSPLALSIYPSWLVLLLNAYNPNILKRLFANDALFNRIVKFLPSAVISAYQFTEINALKIAIGLFIVHFGEILFVSRPLLKKHRTPENVRVYWYLMHIIEGFFVILRLKKLT